MTLRHLMLSIMDDRFRRYWVSKSKTKLEPEFSGYLHDVRFCYFSWKIMLICSGWEIQRRASSDQLIFGLFNPHFNRSTRILTAQLPFWTFNTLGLLHLWIDSTFLFVPQCIGVFARELTFWLHLDVLARASMCWLAPWRFGSRLDISASALMFWLAP